MVFFISLRDIRPSLTYVTGWLAGWLHHFQLTSEHFLDMNERAETKLMKTDIGLLDKPDQHKVELNC